MRRVPASCSARGTRLRRARAGRVGVLKVRLYRPFSIAGFVTALPASTRAIAVLDRTKEPGAVGEPLYQDVVSALHDARLDAQSHVAHDAVVIGGRYGLSSKEFTPAMACATFAELQKPRPKNHFTIGIVDDVSHSSLEWDRDLDIEPADVSRSVFYGLGADGTWAPTLRVVAAAGLCPGHPLRTLANKTADATEGPNGQVVPLTPRWSRQVLPPRRPRRARRRTWRHCPCRPAAATSPGSRSSRPA